MEKTKVTLDLEALSMGDMEAFEDATGLNLAEELAPKPVIDPRTRMPVKDPDDDKGRPLLRVTISSATRTGLVYLGMRRTDPSVTIDQVRAMRVGEIDFELRAGPDDSPLDESEPDAAAQG